ncbi:unnamed protein product [Durusdinium trenchii]|uniref:Uncharacterized protein n=1 Tax=Durusdinium trenchii TaxID=1381693 RepID=A0ABP0SNA4_9DINO
MPKFVDPDSAEVKEKEQAKLQDFLGRQGFEDVHGARSFERGGLIRFEEATPIEVAEKTGNEEVIQLLVKAGAKKRSTGRGWFRQTSLDSNISNIPTRSGSFPRLASLDSADSQAFKLFARFASKASAESQGENKASPPPSPKSCLKGALKAEEEDDGQIFSAWV